MKTRLYWATHHARHVMWDIRFTLACWWLNQRVEYLAWKLQRDALMSTAEPG